MPRPYYGLWPADGGGGDASGVVPLCCAQFRLGAGTEALTSQLGEDVFSGVNVNGPGDYELLITPEFQAVLTDFTKLFLAVGVGGFAARIVMLQPQLPSGNIACSVADAAGAPAAVGILWVTVYYDTEPVPP